MLSIELPAVMENLQVFQEAVIREAELTGFSSKGVFSLQLVLEEVFMNIVNHAYADSESGPVSVAVESAPGEMRIRIEDHGAPFNLLEADKPDTTLDMEDRAIGGMGIMLIRQMAKELSYLREDEKNIVHITMVDS
ncbi:ATP-binding protein [Halodesulfovibrio aestuarii]|uniref:ATP-binding protein n=1 Tax=Halodesulfovibrio aestuarii TaxID=126333 RepID=A0A8G2FI64_9BACT|nr:ATP-binding protein [Halodesulfovibrio aestuarii]SHJ26386.1 Anti-sigma regulatory factor (Ser/Thr protein kinase) [Halodesulfovibrio aestuarii]